MNEFSELDIAVACHEANRALCERLGDFSQLPWDKAPMWQKHSALLGVQFHLENPDATADASHKSWLAEKNRAGWSLGDIKDPKAKTHPCMVPFEDLPPWQQAKDHLFKGVVHALRPLL